MTKEELIKQIQAEKEQLDDDLDSLYGEYYQRARIENIGKEKAYDHVLVLLRDVEEINK